MSNNPLLDELREDDSLPTTSVALPTLGYWYPDDGSVLAEGSDPSDLIVHVLGMIAEQAYRDPFLLISGKALPKLIKSICPGVVKPELLADVDLDAILIAARIVSYGSDMNLEHKCNAVLKDQPKETDEEEKERIAKGEEKKIARCEHSNNLKIDLLEFIGRYSPMTEDYLKRWEVDLERFGQKVFLRPMPYERTMQMLQKSIKAQRGIEQMKDMTYEELFEDGEVLSVYSRTVDESTTLSLESLVRSIHHVNLKRGGEVSDSETIREWLLALPSDTVDMISDRLNELMKEIREVPVVKYKCGACNAPHEIVLQMDPQRLFMKAGDSVQPKKPSPPQSGTKKASKAHTVRSQRSPSPTRAQSNMRT